MSGNQSSQSHQIINNNFLIIKLNESHLSLPRFSFSLLFQLVGHLIQRPGTHITLAHCQSAGHLKGPKGTPYSKAKSIGFGVRGKSTQTAPLSFINYMRQVI